MNKNELISKLNNDIFIEKTLFQLQREFEKIGLAFDYTLNSDYQKLVQQLSQDLSILFKQESNLFKQLLYSIDLPEREVDRIFSSAKDPLDELAELIIIRSAQKVYLRAYFSGDNLTNQDV